MISAAHRSTPLLMPVRKWYIHDQLHPESLYVIVSNPVDVLTYVFLKYTGLPQERVIGSGTVLDTARLRARISEYYKVNQKNVHAYVLGEHGDSSFVPWSLANKKHLHPPR